MSSRSGACPWSLSLVALEALPGALYLLAEIIFLPREYRPGPDWISSKYCSSSRRRSSIPLRFTKISRRLTLSCSASLARSGGSVSVESQPGGPWAVPGVPNRAIPAPRGLRHPPAPVSSVTMACSASAAISGAASAMEAGDSTGGRRRLGFANQYPQRFIRVDAGGCG